VPIERSTYRATILTALLAMILISTVASVATLNASTATQQSTKLILKVYPDGSVRWIGEYYNTTNTSSTGNAAVIFLANLTQLKKGLTLLVNADIKNISTVAKASTANKIEFTLNMSGNISATNESEKTFTNFNLYLNSEENKIKIKAWSIKPLESVLYKKGLYAEISGDVGVAVSGNNAIGIIFALSLLNKGYIESQLAKANITYIDIKQLETTTGPNGATIVFDVGINYTKMIEELSKANTTNKLTLNPEKLKELLEMHFIPHNTTYKISIALYNDNLRARINVNSTLSVMDAVNILVKTMNKYIELYSGNTVAPGTTVPIHANVTKGMEDAKKVLKYLNELTSKFEILPSSAYVLLNVTNKYAHIKFETFKIRAKGAKSPEDTLKTIAEALQELKAEVSNTTLNSSEGKKVKSALDKILGSEAVIEGVGGVKVSQTKVPLNELGNIKVMITQAKTTTTSKTTTAQTPSTSPASTTTITTSFTQTSSATSSTTSSTTTRTTTTSTTTSSKTTPSTTSTTTAASSPSTSTKSTASTSTTANQGKGLPATTIIVGVIVAVIVVGAAVAIAKR